MFTIANDIEFLGALADDIGDMDDAAAPYIVLRLRVLVQRLTQLQNVTEAAARRIADSFQQQAQQNTAEPPTVANDYHCGNSDCDACNEAVGVDANGSPVPPEAS